VCMPIKIAITKSKGNPRRRKDKGLGLSRVVINNYKKPLGSHLRLKEEKKTREKRLKEGEMAAKKGSR